MRRTEVNVFLVAMAILPFLQNMLLNIGTGHYIHVCMYTVYMNFRQNFSRKKNIFAISEKNLAETVHYIPKGLRKGNPFHGPFAQLSYIYMIFYACISILYRLSVYVYMTLTRVSALNEAPISQQMSKISEGLALLPVLITSKKPANSTLLSSISKAESVPLGCERLQLRGFVFCETDADLVKNDQDETCLK